MMHATAEIDVLACPECGGRLHLLATIEDPAVVRRSLASAPRTRCPQPLPARSPPWVQQFPESFDFQED